MTEAIPKVGGADEPCGEDGRYKGRALASHASGRRPVPARFEQKTVITNAWKPLTWL